MLPSMTLTFSTFSCQLLLFLPQLFLSANPTVWGIIGEKYTADIPEGSQSTTLVAGQQLKITRANALINTEGLVCPVGGLYLCAELFKPANASYSLNGFNSSAMMVDDDLLIACEMVECRGTLFSLIESILYKGLLFNHFSLKGIPQKSFSLFCHVPYCIS